MASVAYQSSESKKEEYKKYLEKANVIDALTKVLVTLYEEQERPPKPVEFIKKALGGPSQVCDHPPPPPQRRCPTPHPFATLFPPTVPVLQSDYDNLRAENEELKEKVAKLEAELKSRVCWPSSSSAFHRTCTTHTG